MWQNVLIVGVVLGRASNSNPYVRVHGVNEHGEDRVWAGFGNERVTTRPIRRIKHEDFEREVFFSGNMHLLLAAVDPDSQDRFRRYLQEVMQAGNEAQAIKLEQQLFSPFRALAADFGQGSAGTGAANAIEDRIIGHVVLVDWDPAGFHGRGSPATHGLGFLPSPFDPIGPSDLFAGRKVSTWLKQFAAKRPRTMEESIREAQAAMADAPDLIDVPVRASEPAPASGDLDDLDLDNLYG